MDDDKETKNDIPPPYVVEFDSYPGAVGQVTITFDDTYNMDLSITCDGQRTTIIRTLRDQWGVFIDVGDVNVAQEDGTRSFLDALSQALQHMRKMCECETTPGTVTT